MKKIRNILAGLGLYWQYILDTILTHFFVIIFLRNGYPAFAAVLMSIDSLFKAVFSVLSGYVVALIPMAIRGRLSVIFKSTLLILWYLAISVSVKDQLSFFAIILFVIFKIILLIDSFFSAEFIFELKKYLSIDLTQSAAMQNILVRASTAMAPAISLLILFNPNIDLIVLALATLIFGVSIILLRRIYFLSMESISPKYVKPVSISRLIQNPYAAWGFLYQILGNLAFAGVAFLLLRQLPQHPHIFLNEISILYFAFFIVQGIILFFGEDFVPINNTFQIASIMGLCGCFVLLAGICSYEYLRFACCLLIGILYSLTLSAVQKVVITQLRGAGYVEFIGWAQTVGRLSSFSITMLLGFALSIGVNSSLLLTICGALGIMSAILLVNFSNNLAFKFDS